jgi:hypothetical protein
MKKIVILMLGLLGLVLCLAALSAYGNADQPSGQPAKPDKSVVTDEPKDPEAVVRAEEQYVKALLASARDPALKEERQIGYWVRLARLGYMPAFERISKLVTEEERGFGGLGGLVWAGSLQAIQGDRATVVKLLGSEKQELRWTGILLAGYLGMKKELGEFAEFAEKAVNLDPTTRRRGLWVGRALARDFSIVPALAAASEDKAADGHMARAALAAYFSETGEMSLADFQKRLEAVLADTRPAAKAAAKPATGSGN